ncbi:MAG: hypothetical protein A2452_13440 [Candidatus Firestonebacteria bacterium RIFOXYC2_FULL_39_67]|nr:MAG: hypothetical protein A2536_05290 [Candidatus Firestonebacteria bacterium RIFOXYD2_FULL_39_29]OGF56210.1 MAG: hypothetical protein A2452_13440 [Candidatus Firestonebacteria bacterium RIFOXYC2_FULL_39_67]
MITLKPSGVKGVKIIEQNKDMCIFRVPQFWLERLRIIKLRFVLENSILFFTSLAFMLINGRKIEIVNGHGYSPFLVILKYAFRNKRFIFTTHHLYNSLGRSKFRNKIVKWTLNGLDHILAVSSISRNEIIDLGINPLKVTVYDQWVNADIFYQRDKTAAKIKTALNGKFVVLFMGRFAKEKGPGLLVEIATEIKEDIYFAFAGAGLLEEYIKRTAAVNKRILMLGKIANMDIPNYLAAADIIVVPSLWEDPRPRVLLEALAMGLPIVATKRGGIPETILNAGIIVNEPVKDGIKEAILMLFREQKKREMYSQKALKLSKIKYSEDNANFIIGLLTGNERY